MKSEKRLLDESGYPRVAASFGGGGTPQFYMGSFPAFLAAWGPCDMGFGSGQGVKCYHSEHLYGELWHRGFTVSPDTPLTNYLISCGANVEASGGVAGVWRHANARSRGMKRVQVEPHLSVTAPARPRVPIKPKTDAAFLYALIHVLLHEEPRSRLDLEFLYRHTSAVSRRRERLLPARSGLRAADHRRLARSEGDARGARDRPGRRCARRRPARRRDRVRQARRAHEAVFAGMGAGDLRRARGDHPAHRASISKQPVSEKRSRLKGTSCRTAGRREPRQNRDQRLGRLECCWARTLLASLVGALEVPGGILGTTVRLNRPMSERHRSVKAGPDGLMNYPFNPTDAAHWSAQPNIRNAYRSMVPLAADGPWSQALGPTHFSWMFLDETPPGCRASRSRALVSVPHQPGDLVLGHRRAREPHGALPVRRRLRFTRDETNHFADILLPDAGDLESLQLIRIGGSKYIEQFWDHEGFALRQPAIAPRGQRATSPTSPPTSPRAAASSRATTPRSTAAPVCR